MKQLPEEPKDKPKACYYCGASNTLVLHTRLVARGIYRQRVCLHCSKRFSTIETKK